MTNMEEKRALWLAGITDCEGSIFIGKHKRRSKERVWYTYDLIWSLTMTNKNFLEDVKCNLNWPKKKIRIHKKANKQYKGSFMSFKTQFLLSTTKDSELRIILKEILPFLIIKKEQALLGLSFLDFKKVNLSKGKRPSPEAIQRLETYYQEMRQLNS